MIIFAVLSFFFCRAMAEQDPGRHLWNAMVDLICIGIFLLTGTSLNGLDGAVILGILALDLTGYALLKS